VIGTMVMMACLALAPAHAVTGGGPSGATGDTGATTPTVATAATGTTGATGDTAIDTIDTDEPTTTDSATTGGSGIADTDTCLDCYVASDLAGDEGGSPCGDCSTGGGSPWLAGLALIAVMRRRR
jgi:MYXO-CTERM domain-containing protein